MQERTRRRQSNPTADEQQTKSQIKPPDVTAAKDAVATAVSAPLPTMPPVARILDQALREIAVRGWCQGFLMNDGGAVCTLGAIKMATIALGSDLEDHRSAIVATCQAVPDEYRLVKSRSAYGPTVIANYNDDSGTRQSDVIDVLVKARNRAIVSGK